MNLRVGLNWVGDRIAALPLAVIYVTDRCNSRCSACDFWRSGATDLPVVRARRLAGELKSMGTDTVLLTGGEPLFHPRWRDVAASFREADLRLWLLTAGLSLEKEAAAIAGLLDKVTISLDGATPGTYRAVRGVDAFHTVCEGIRAVVARGTWVSLRVTVQRANYREIPDLVRLGHRLGVKEVSFLAVDVGNPVAFGAKRRARHEAALASEDLPVLADVLMVLQRDFASEMASGFIAETPEKLSRLHQYFAALLGEARFPPVRCNVPRFSAVVRADGSLQPCFFIDGGESVVHGNGLGLGDALNSPEARRLRAAVRRGSRPECERCVCSMWRSPQDLMFRSREGMF